MTKLLDFPNEFDICITCATGVEKVVKSELKRLGYPESPALNGSIVFKGDALAVAKCNVFLRSADRVYIRAGNFTATSFDQLFEGVYSIDWGAFLPSDAKVIVNGKCVKSQLFAVSACQSIVKKAIINKMAKTYGCNTFLENGATYGVEFFIVNDQVSILLNTSGVGLHKRGYRDLVGIAPIKETLASALLLLSDFYWQRPFYDPFCGSGTICIEATNIALNIASGLNRRFDFCEWKNFDKNAFALAREEAFDQRRLDRKVEIFGSDIDKKAIALCKRHAQRAGVLDYIDFKVLDVKNFCPQGDVGTIVTNPPYGERVYDKEEAIECYKNLGRALKDKPKFSAFVITAEKSFEKHFGKKADRERKLFNSNKECRYFYYYGKKE